MAYSDNFPAVRPVFQSDFANGGRIDPRISYSRSTTGTYFGTAKHESSQNLFVQSSDFDTTWGRAGLNVPPTGGQADPSGGTDGFTWVENTQTTFHQFYQDITASGELALTIYAKQNSGTRYLMFRFYNGSGDWTVAVFDLAGGAPLTVNSASSTRTSVSATQTASGNGFYKCTLKATGSTASAVIALKNTYDTSGLSSSSGGASYAGDNTSSIDVAFASLTTTGATDYQSTTTQIHRAYAPTLQTAAINAPRFEYSPTDSASMGLLIEGSSTNLLPYSSDASQLSGVKNEVESNVAIAPDGTLTADKMRVDDAVGTGNSLRIGTWSVTSGQKYTISYYAKAAELGFIVINFRNLNSAFASAHAYYNLNTGTVDANSGLDSYGMESCGNGWYRCWATATATATATGTYYLWAVNDAAGTPIDRDGYSGVLIWGGQIENQSFPSSYIATSGSTVTRAADSASMDLTQAGFNGGPVTIVSETEGGRGVYPQSFVLTDGTGSNQISVYRNSAAATTTTNWYLYVASDGSNQVLANIPASDTAGKLAVSLNTNDAAFTTVGNSVTTDTSVTIPSGLSQLKIGASWTGGTNHLNGHCKRIALYGEALSDTNLQALTS